MVKVTVWNENLHEKDIKEVQEMYPKGIHNAIAQGIAQPDFEIRTAVMEEPEHGLSEEVLNNTDVLIWWSHAGHDMVQDEVVERIYQRVLNGMGLIVLHSSHVSKIFRKITGTSGALKWREIGEKERLWVVDPSHPITEGIGEFIELEHEEMYGEFFDIPNPDELVFVSWFQGGEVFRSGFTYHRGKGKVFYFRPGHETYPTYYNKEILKVMQNAVRYTAPVQNDVPMPKNLMVEPLEDIKSAIKVD